MKFKGNGEELDVECPDFEELKARVQELERIVKGLNGTGVNFNYSPPTLSSAQIPQFQGTITTFGGTVIRDFKKSLVPQNGKPECGNCGWDGVTPLDSGEVKSEGA